MMSHQLVTERDRTHKYKKKKVYFSEGIPILVELFFFSFLSLPRTVVFKPLGDERKRANYMKPTSTLFWL